MGLYTYYIHNSKTGLPVAEVPLRDVSFTDALTGIGTASATIALDHPKATRTIFGGKVQGGRELTIVRGQGSGAKCVWHGPIVKRRASLKDKKLTLDCVDPFWYLTKRTLEGDRNYNRVPAQIALNMFEHALTKANGSLYRFTMDSRSDGTLTKVAYQAASRSNIGRNIMDLSTGDEQGFDFRMRYTWNRSVREVSRHLEVGVPYMGTKITTRALQMGAGMTDLEVEEDEDRSGNRIHVIGGGTGNKKYRATTNNNASLAKTVLLEMVYEVPDILSQAMVSSICGFYRNTASPPVASYTATYRPTAALPYDWCQPGDTVRLKSPYGYFDDNDYRRVVALTTTVDNSGLEEEIKLSFYAADEGVL